METLQGALALPSSLSTLTLGQRNILAMYLRASIAERMDGSLWYARARGICSALAVSLGVSTEIVAGVVALLSPRNAWHRNITDAESLITHYISGGTGPGDIKCCTYNSNKEKAWKLLELGHVEPSLFGKKQFNFYLNMTTTTTGGKDAVTVDGHAYHIWLGVERPLSRAKTISEKLYITITHDYQVVSDLLGLRPCQIQATTWLTYKRLRNV
jgi:hypothetical protein